MRRGIHDPSGQAAAEVLAGIPALVLAGLIALQLLAVGYTATLTGGAVEAGALALVAGEAPGPAVRDALPGWARERVETVVNGGQVEVSLRPPALLPSMAGALEIGDSAWVRPAS